MKLIPQKEEWWIWSPCSIHDVVWMPVIEQWNCDADLYPEHARVCREASGCCLQKLPEGFRSMLIRGIARILGRPVRRRTDNPKGPWDYSRLMTESLKK